MSRIVNIGIDLGTTNTLCCMQDNHGKVLPIKFMKTGNDINLPSVIFYSGGKIEVGKRALEKSRINPDNAYLSSKTQLGTDKHKVFDGKVFTPVDAAACILKEVRSNVCSYINKWYEETEPEIEAVITYPAYFSQTQIDETKRAGELAGIKVKKLISEPMAAALAYISDEDIMGSNGNDRLLVVDIGGGTFDLSLLEYDRANDIYKAIGVGGNPHLGGDDFDKAIVDGFVETIQFETDEKIDLSSEQAAKDSGIDHAQYMSIMAELRKEAERLKIELSSNDIWPVQIDSLFTLPDGSDYTLDISEYSRDTFDERCKPLYDKISESIERFCNENNITPDNIWRVALVGGSCYIPYIINMIRSIFPEEKVFADQPMNSLVAYGAYLASLNLSDAQGGIKYTDTLAHSLGIRIKGGVFSEILSKQPYPCSVTMTYETTADHQRSVKIDVYETRDIGEDDSMIRNCRYYGTLELEGLEDRPAGEVKIDVTLTYDESRILTVTVKELNTGKQKEIVLKKGVDAAPSKSKAKPMDIFLLIDKSGSMDEPASSFSKKTRIAEAVDAAKSMIENMVDLSANRMGIGSFGTASTVDCPLTNKSANLIKGLEKIVPHGQTLLNQGFDMLTNQVFKNADSRREQWAIVITDGHPYNQKSADNAAERLKQKGVKVITIGVGLDEKGIESNRRIASARNDGTKFSYSISEMTQLSGIFEEIIDEIQPANNRTGK